jgi:hypothetical protein
MKLHLIKLLLVFISLFIFSGCGIYSFTGTNISPDIKTISIKNYVNETGLGPSRLGQNFTEKLKEYFLQNTNLKLVKSDGDLQLEGSIIGYTLGPVGAQQGNSGQIVTQTGQQNRLSIIIKSKFTNTKDESIDFNKDFSHYEDFASNQSLSAVESEKVEIVLDRIVFDTFNASVANW